MEKQSSRNSPDNCPLVIFFSPLLLFALLCFFICSFPIQSFFPPTSLFRVSDSRAFFGERKEKRENSSLHVFPQREGSQGNHSGLCWFSRNVNRTHRLSQCWRKTGELSSFLARCYRCHCFSKAVPEDGRGGRKRKYFPFWFFSLSEQVS